MKNLRLYIIFLWVLTFISCGKEDICSNDPFTIATQPGNAGCLIPLNSNVHMQVTIINGEPVLACETDNDYPYPGYKIIFELSFTGDTVLISFTGVDACSSQPMTVLSPAKCTIPLTGICEGSYDLLISNKGNVSSGKLSVAGDPSGTAVTSMEASSWLFISR